MIYLVRNSMNYVIGVFDTIALAKTYLSSIGVTTYEDFSYLMRIEDMTYASRICYVDGICIYNNKNFWLNTSNTIYDNYESHTVTDFMNKIVYKDQFKQEMNRNSMRLNNIYTTSDEVNYNIDIGFEFITLFREECVNADLGSLNGLSIASKTANLIPLIMTGSFKESLTVLSTYTTDEYFTTERLSKYKAMIASADVITYQR